MSALILVAVEALLKALAPELGPLIVKLLTYWVDEITTPTPAGEDFAARAASIVAQLDDAHPDWPGEEKRATAAADVAALMRQLGRPDLAEGHLPNLLVEVAVAAQKAPAA